ncbi:MAG: hypothetical protein JSV37_05270 [Anaerolineaceae bacterium]|nr:MAG: hypothetical protein JSV37_05270 [Anaerolineaceae bacterium]
MKRLLVVVCASVLILSACQQAQTEKSLYGSWDYQFVRYKFNEDGSWSRVDIISTSGGASVGRNPINWGTFTFDGKLLTMFTDEESRDCSGQTGIYEITFPEEGSWNLIFKKVEDPCSVREKEMINKFYLRYSP